MVTPTPTPSPSPNPNPNLNPDQVPERWISVTVSANASANLATFAADLDPARRLGETPDPSPSRKAYSTPHRARRLGETTETNTSDWAVTVQIAFEVIEHARYVVGLLQAAMP